MKWLLKQNPKKMFWSGVWEEKQNKSSVNMSQGRLNLICNGMLNSLKSNKKWMKNKRDRKNNLNLMIKNLKQYWKAKEIKDLTARLILMKNISVICLPTPLNM